MSHHIYAHPRHRAIAWYNSKDTMSPPFYWIAGLGAGFRPIKSATSGRGGFCVRRTPHLRQPENWFSGGLCCFGSAAPPLPLYIVSALDQPGTPTTTLQRVAPSLTMDRLIKGTGDHWAYYAMLTGCRVALPVPAPPK